MAFETHVMPSQEAGAICPTPPPSFMYTYKMALTLGQMNSLNIRAKQLENGSLMTILIF